MSWLFDRNARNLCPVASLLLLSVESLRHSLAKSDTE
jgi:hypothetical protein